MDRNQANQKLIDCEHDFFTLNCHNITKYAAVIQDPFSSEPEKFIIEVALKSGNLVYPNIPPSLKKEFHNDFIEKNFEVFPKSIQYDVKNKNVHFIQYQEKPCTEIKEDTSYHRELTGGISISKKDDNESGTAGMFFYMSSDMEEKFFISNYHVIADGNSEIGETQIFHPGYSDNYEESKVIGELFWHNTDLDAAIGIVVNNHPIKNNHLSKFQNITICSIEQNLMEGMIVKKCGKMTGVTSGTLRSTNCTVNLTNRSDCRGITKKNRNLLLTDCMSHGGDSGSMLISDNNKLVGLLIGGNKITGSYYVDAKKIFKSNKFPEINFYKTI